MATKRSGGNGRKKTVHRRIVKEDARQVCFSKRKRGLFNKASELALLTCARVTAVVFSPGGKAYSFGHSSVDAVVNRFMAGGGEGEQGPADDNQLQELHRQDGEMRAELAERKKRKKRVEEALAKERVAGDQIAAWVDADVRDMGYEDMAAFAAALMQVQAAVSGRTNQVLVEAFHVDISRKLQVPPPPAPPQLFGTFEFGSSSSANAGFEMQQMQMVMHPPQMVMLPPQAFAAGMHMAIPQQPGFAGGMEMEIQPQPGFFAGTEIEQMLMAMLPAIPEFPAGMDMAQQGLGPNPGFPY